MTSITIFETTADAIVFELKSDPVTLTLTAAIGDGSTTDAVRLGIQAAVANSDWASLSEIFDIHIVESMGVVRVRSQRGLETKSGALMDQYVLRLPRAEWDAALHPLRSLV